MADAKRDANFIPTLLAVSSADGVTPVVLWADPTTHRLLVDLGTSVGDVTGPSSATNNALVRFNGTTGKIIQDYTSGAPTVSDTGDMVIGQTLTLANTGLHIFDTGGDHDLIIKPGSDLGADRILTLTTGDAARTIILSGNPTLADWFDQAVKVASSPTFAGATFSGAVDMGDQLINNLADAVNPADAVNLQTLLENTGLTLNYWISNQTITTTLTDSEASLQETPSSDPETLTTITFKSSVADTPTPFTLQAGAIVEIHFDADVTSSAGKHTEQLKCQLGYVDSDGTSNFVQIGADSDLTVALTEAKTAYGLHIHITSTTTVPAGKRLWLKVIADATTSGGSYPEINFYYDDPEHHMLFAVAGSIIENYLLLAGGTMTGDILGAITLGVTGTRLTKGWFADLQTTNAPIVDSLTASEILASGASKELVSLAVATYPSLAELAYVKGVTSAIQTQLGNKQATISFGTGVETALGVNIGSAGAPALFDGALGTPSSGTATNITGLPASGVINTAATLTDTQILTNKRITPRVSTEASAAEPTIDTDAVDAHSITALATAVTSMTTNLSGTPTNFQKLIVRFLDNGTGRAISWGASFEDNGAVLPTTTTASKLLTVGFIYDTASSKWGCVAVADET
jgi:hypothetical protein